MMQQYITDLLVSNYTKTLLKMMCVLASHEETKVTK